MHAESPAEILIGITVEIFLLLVAVGVLYRIWSGVVPMPRRLVVPAFQRGVILKRGQIEREVGPGAYWITPKRTLALCDVRPTPFQVQAQELLTLDRMVVRVSLAGEYRASHPTRFVTQSSDAFATFYLEVRQALRTAVSELNAQDFGAGQGTIVGRMKELLIPKAFQLGIEMTQLEVYEAVTVGQPHASN